ncbi:hypothetical protein HK099_007635 [Clydaea vesicula]|uniref:sphingolipid C(9)-methyltransferase n=1 Tax=Clydaea vesicula TaxID=447962 RepID=A0AAD5U6K1_9FUNG|nr:hypothetical protein HK099_007635 [Clydaea vesicula]
MLQELEITANLMISFLKSSSEFHHYDLLTNFKSTLIEKLRQKFLLVSWDTENAELGSAFRCLGSNDKVLVESAEQAGILHFASYLPRDICIWVDPNNVSYRIREHSAIVTHWENLSGNGASSQKASTKYLAYNTSSYNNQDYHYNNNSNLHEMSNAYSTQQHKVLNQVVKSKYVDVKQQNSNITRFNTSFNEKIKIKTTPRKLIEGEKSNLTLSVQQQQQLFTQSKSKRTNKSLANRSNSSSKYFSSLGARSTSSSPTLKSKGYLPHTTNTSFNSSPMGKQTSSVPVPPYPVDSQGFDTFSNTQLYIALAVAPLAAVLVLPIHFYWYPVVAVILALPTFAAYNMLNVLSTSNLSYTNLPNRDLSYYFTVKDKSLKKYQGRNKIPMETWFEAYFDQKIDTNVDMLEMIEARHDWASFVFTLGQAKFFLTQWIPETLWHSKKQDELQVREHYDRGDDFYEAFLGPMMVYTSGIMQDVDTFESLEQLQQQKLDLVTEKIKLKAGEKMLDIGCGWGTLSVHAAKQGAHVTGVTLGRNQNEWCMNRARQVGVEKNVRILCMDYRDIPKEKYDKITCLEMAEHVGVLRFQTFLQQVKSMLTDEGIFYLQIAGLRRAWQYEDLTWGLFMAKYVFPGADASPPLNWVIEQLERAGFEVQNTDTIGVHYSATIYRWYLNWMKNKDRMIEKYGVVWFRRWEVFLAWSTVVARQGSATCYQIVCHKNSNKYDRVALQKSNRFITSKKSPVLFEKGIHF